MSSAILVSPGFDRSWPFAADHFHRLWKAQGRVTFVRMEDGDIRPAGRTLRPGAGIRRMAVLQVPFTPECLASFEKSAPGFQFPAAGLEASCRMSAGWRVTWEPGAGKGKVHGESEHPIADLARPVRDGAGGYHAARGNLPPHVGGRAARPGHRGAPSAGRGGDGLRTCRFSPLSGDMQVAYLLPAHRYGKGLYQEEPSSLGSGCLETLTDAIAARIDALRRCL